MGFFQKKPPGKTTLLPPSRAREGNFVVLSAIFFELVKLSLKLLILKIRNPMF